MKSILIILSLITLTSCKEFEVTQSKMLGSFICKSKENCLSSKETGEKNILAFKMMGENEQQNILNISKLIRKMGDIKIVKLEGNYLYAFTERTHLEFIANQKDRKIHIRSQVSKGSIFGNDKGKKLIEEIRFKFYQNDY